MAVLEIPAGKRDAGEEPLKGAMRELSEETGLVAGKFVSLGEFYPSPGYVDEVIYANDNYKGSGDVALIAHSHLDVAYYWRRIHAVQKNLRTVLIQLRLMDKYPDFKYTHTQPYVYETLENFKAL